MRYSSFVLLLLFSFSKLSFSEESNWLLDQSQKLMKIAAERNDNYSFAKKPPSPISIEDAKKLFGVNSPLVINSERVRSVVDSIDQSQNKLIFVSLSMPNNAFQLIVDNAISTKSTLIFNGISEGSNFHSFRKEILSRLRNNSEIPPISIDPLEFEKYAVKVVPTIVITEKNVLKRKVKGTANITWLLERTENKKDFGVLGPTYQILEESIVEMIKKRLDTIDWEEKKRKAVSRYWANREFIELENVKEAYKFYVDPSIEVTKDIITPEGQVIANKGDMINPLEKIGFTKTYIVFDATNILQREFVRDQIANLDADGAVAVLITTRMERSKSWKGLTELEQYYEQPVYFLKREIVERFGLSKVPSFIYAENKMIVVNEKPYQ